MRIKIPEPCPKCGGKLEAVTHDPVLKLLKERCWHVCTECNYQKDTEKFKNELFTV